MLPVEILDYIFSGLDVHSLEATVKAQPLSGFSRIAERHLYANIALRNYPNHDDTKRSDSKLPLEVGQFSTLLSKRPHIADYVLNLTIAVGWDGDKVPFLEAIPSILALLLKLRALMLIHEPGLWVPSLALPEGLCLSLAKSFQIPSMKHVEVFGATIPLSLLHQCSNTVEVLVFDSSCIIESNPDHSEVGSSSFDYPPLKDLRMIRVRNGSLNGLVPRLANGCRQLRHFMFCPTINESFVLIKPIIASCSNTLTVLNVDLCSLYDVHESSNELEDLSRHWTLPALPHLQDFIFHGQMFPETIWSSFLFFALRCFLGIMPLLERLTFHLHVEASDWHGMLGVDSSPGLDWPELDSFLATSCSSAKVIDLRISTKYRSDHDIKASLMEYPNIRRMVDQNALIITASLLHRECDCSVIRI